MNQTKLTQTAARILKNSSIFRKSPGNSFATFKEYRETAKTYGPLSASLATKRNLTNK
ncbi:uncharacterized protein GVI51_I04059 [Nakaseomyces glabratus]|uniref:ATP synthase subunit epsilon, mitochondrial n=1 Tax=Candida glabrata (strain ATCC 2001 / BCRC 20586 / JCM 3761 / NBRC 0622 / NRRL Y-65 / CBS 138) TaxID=284593 RepID=B4UN14_CANGA|nr:uncharacterized protein CAGL0I04328g [Nakaseomyces glabratus]KAH7580709.1 hypothetical protein J7296_04075 [Nakaseomyces glabratus]KAH7585746.1 hypothetical protein J7298_02711 [Nakaseomyces glabratus]KAH7587435.1 hypothetical protein J7297_02709 [Nakaseomyces glabratus]KAH7599378.1 hypothetical protein J7295_02718 [Nakaseomyces glabratus]KAH7599692.1 hypothetical protein J7294_02707 [Nakaseomyces glabratus]|eukprot:XP_002999557.1 uncharacterized protein CAGL0I04328g [[Candida] glabrata]